MARPAAPDVAAAPLIAASATYRAIGYVVTLERPDALMLETGGRHNARAWRAARALSAIASRRMAPGRDLAPMGAPGPRPPLWRLIVRATAALERLAIIRQPVVIITLTSEGVAIA